VSRTLRMKLSGVVLDSPDANILAGFYRQLLGWEVEQDEPDWIKLKAPDGGAGLSFQTEAAYVRPIWPAGPGGQQMMVHLDIAVDDLDVAGVHAVAAARSSRIISLRTTSGFTSTLRVTRFAYSSASSPTDWVCVLLFTSPPATWGKPDSPWIRKLGYGTTCNAGTSLASFAAPWEIDRKSGDLSDSAFG
jgi:Glyoxalase-like domain